MKAKAMWAGLAVVVLLAVVAVGYAFYYRLTAEDRQRNERISWAQKVVADNLIDGESARFRNVRLVGSVTVCGEVNAKNRYGAYVGFHGFSVLGVENDPKPSVNLADNEDSLETEFYKIKCEQKP